MLSDIEKIIINGKVKVYNTLKMEPSAYIYVFVLTFLCHRVLGGIGRGMNVRV